MIAMLKALWAKLTGGSADFVAIGADDVPNDIRRGKLVLVGEPHRPWLAMMRCPCGCDAIIQLPLSGESGPRWRTSGPAKQPSLKPSVWRTTGCKSHFVLRKGNVIWCGGEPD